MLAGILLVTLVCVHSLEGGTIPPEKLSCSIRTESHLARDAGTDSRLKWPDATVYYTIDSAYSSKHADLILKSFRKLEEYTCIRFRERRREKDYVVVSPRGSQSGCNADLGRIGGKQELNLETRGCMYEDTVIHEAMHTLGFNHEHQRPDRDDYIDVIWDNLEKGRDDSDFQRISSRKFDTQGITYDYASIMHYQWNDNAINDRKPTMVSRDSRYDLRDYKHDRMTQLDVDRINGWYCH